MATIKGTAKKDKLTGTASGDVILGLGADDILSGGSGNDVLKGGVGNDTLSGGIGNDKLYGEAGKDKLIGGTGNDRLDGGAGDDVMIGGDGNDRLIDSAGADRFNGGSGLDTADYSTVTSGTGISLALDNSVSAGSSLGDTFFFIENVVGTQYGDAIIGSSVANTLIGGAGSDAIRALAGSDKLTGDDGNDILDPGDDADVDVIDGGDGRDTVSYLSSSIGVSVNLELDQVGGGAAGDVLISIESVTGSTHDDELVVTKGGTADGGGGNDTLSGSRSSALVETRTTEFLIGEDGADQFEVHYNTGMDVIRDFTAGSLFVAGDRLIIKASEFGGIQHLPDVTGASTAILNISGATVIFPSRTGPQLIFDQTTSYLYFDEDGTGFSFAPVPVAYLDGFHGPLTHGGPLLSVDEFEIV